MSGLQVPYKESVSLSVGSSVTIIGKPAVSFSLDPELQVDFHTENDEDSDIPFSIRVYFGNCVVMNSRDDGKWRYEVKSSDVPFVNGKEFELCISVLKDEYQVKVNGQIKYNFPYRVNPKFVKMLEVWRDVCLASVSVSKGDQ